MTVTEAVKASGKAAWQCARQVCPPWLLVVLGVCAVIPLDPFDELVPLPFVLWYIWRNPAARRECAARLCLIWYEGMVAL